MNLIQRLRTMVIPDWALAREMMSKAANVLEKQQAEIERLNGYIQKANMDVTEALVERDSLNAQAEKDAADAGRYRWLRDNQSYHFSMQPDSPAEHGIEYQWVQSNYAERNAGINETIDAAIEDAAMKESQ